MRLSVESDSSLGRAIQKSTILEEVPMAANSLPLQGATYRKTPLIYRVNLVEEKGFEPSTLKLLNVVLFEIDAFSLQRISAKVRVFIDMLVDRFRQQRHGKSLMACSAAVPWSSECRETS